MDDVCADEREADRLPDWDVDLVGGSEIS